MEGEHRNHRVITFSIAVRVNKYLGKENHSKHKNQLKMGDIIILVYDITDKSSFDEIEKWFEMIK